MITQAERPINIKDLVIDELASAKAGSEGFFDPEEGFDDGNWDSLVDFLNLTAEEGSRDFPDLAYKTAVLLPSRFPTFDIGSSAGKLLSTFNILSSPGVGRKDFPDFVRNLRVLFPGSFASIRFDVIYQSQLAEAEEYLKGRVANNDFSPRLVEELLAYKIAFPGRFPALGLGEDNWQAVKNSARATSSSVAYFGCARALFPNHQEEKLVDAGAVAWLRKMAEEEKRGGNWRLFINFGYDLLLATANKIDVSEGGISVEVKRSLPNLEATLLPIPEVRRF